MSPVGMEATAKKFSGHNVVFPLGKPKAAPREAIQDVMHAGARAFLHYEEIPSAADLKRIGLSEAEAASYPVGYHGKFGLYRYATDHRGYAVILFSQNPDNMKPQLMPEWIRRYPGTPFPGAYLSRGDLSHVFAVGARQARSRSPWEREEIASHEKSWWDNLLNAGTLFRVGATRWASSHFLYEMNPVRNKIRDRLRPDLAGSEEQLYAVKLLTTTWHRQIPHGHKVNMYLTRLLSLGPPPVLMTMAEAEKRIPEDFFKRAHLVVKGLDPYDNLRAFAGEKERERGGSLVGRGWGLACQSWLRALRKIEDTFIVPDFSTRHSYWKTQLIKTAASASLKAAIRLNPAMIVREFLLGVVDKVFGKAIGSAARPAEKEFVDEFLRPGRIKYVLDHKSYGKIDQEKAVYMRLLTAREAVADNFILAAQGPVRVLPPEDKEAVREQWALDYILSTAKAPFGSEAALYEKNGHDVLVVNQANGLRAYYVPGMNLAYAELDPALRREGAAPIPAPVARLMQGTGLVKVWDEGGRGLRFTALGSKEEMITDMDRTMIPVLRRQEMANLPAGPDFIHYKPERHDPRCSHDIPRPGYDSYRYQPWKNKAGSLLTTWRQIEDEKRRRAPVSDALGKVDDVRDVLGAVQRLVVS